MRSVLATRLAPLSPQQRERFHGLYRDHFDFVFRNLRRLGVQASQVEDALQDVYVVALRRIADFAPGTHEKAWLFAIVLRVAGNYRRSVRRRGDPLPLEHTTLAAPHAGPFDAAAQQEARQVLHTFLASLDEQRRAVFVMTELEQMTAPEIAEALSANLNTVYSWLRAARQEFVRALEKAGRRRG